MKLIPSVQRALESVVEVKEQNTSQTKLKEKSLYQHRKSRVPASKLDDLDDLDDLERFCFVLSSN
ncbi:hypothetical protein [Amphritea sp. HPY]|uniref:hypothetical protein n=1 Tax=Amphritea sp. HPY TaxID=3421652 RepID=UPI003D7DBBCB